MGIMEMMATHFVLLELDSHMDLPLLLEMLLDVDSILLITLVFIQRMVLILVIASFVWSYDICIGVSFDSYYQLA